MNERKVWRVAGASAIGTAHIDQRTECQDRLLWRAIDTGEGATLVAAIADGAGSTTDGQRGAEIACRTFVEAVEEFLSAGDASLRSLNRDFGAHFIGYFQSRVKALADRERKALRDYASTLVAAVAGASGAVFYQIGDGGAVYSASGAKQSYAFGIEPIEAEYVNVTDFATDDEAAERIRFRFVEGPVEDLILFSDGVASVAVDYQQNRPHEPFLMPMIAPLRRGAAAAGLDEKLASFLASPKINEKTDDDKTIILASCAGARQAALG